MLSHTRPASSLLPALGLAFAPDGKLLCFRMVIRGTVPFTRQLGCARMSNWTPAVCKATGGFEQEMLTVVDCRARNKELGSHS